MDSLTHLVLGAAVGELILGRKLGNKAMLLGALANTIPDFDIFYNLIESDPIKKLTFHRSFTHAVFFQFFIAAGLAWLSKKWSKKDVTFRHWYVFWFAGLFTHAMMDCCTTYGTQLLLPFTNYQVAFNNISVIDVLFTIPFLILVLICLFIKRKNPLRQKFLKASFAYCISYLIVTIFIKYDIHHKFKQSLQQNNIKYTELNSTPTILNAILWSAIAYNDSMIWCAEYSFLLPEVPITWIGYKRNPEAAEEFSSEALEALKWFSDGNYFVQKEGNDTLNFYNIKWGRTRFDSTEPKKAFLFYMVLHRENGIIKSKDVQPRDWSFREALDMLMERIGV